MERLIWWTALLLFGLTIALGSFVLATTIASNPEIAAFVLGLLAFWLFANKLIFGFGQIANFASNFVEGAEINKEKLAQKVVKHKEEAKLRNLEESTVVSTLSLWRGILEPFKYAYYIGFFLIFLLAVLFKLNVISSLVFGPIVEALTLGAAIPTVLAWGLELMSNYYLSQAFAMAISQLGDKEK